MTRARIIELAEKYTFYVSFSGGKDSAVAVDYTAKVLKSLGYRKMYVLNINTGLEYMSVHRFVKPFCEYVAQKYDIEAVLDIETPETVFADTLKTYGYPLISKEVSQCIEEARKGLKNNDGTYSYRLERLDGEYRDKDGNLSPYNMSQYKFLLNAPCRISHLCCQKQKKDPAIAYEERTGRTPLVATTAQESRLRASKWKKHGCNAFDLKRPMSAPFSTWLNNDMLQYTKEENLPLAEAYGEIVVVNDTGVDGQINLFDSTGYEGCKYCTTGCQRTGCLYCLFGITQDLDRIIRLQEMEPARADYVLSGGTFDSEGYWVPTKEGLGYWLILDWLKENGIDVPYKNKKKYRRKEAWERVIA